MIAQDRCTFCNERLPLQADKPGRRTAAGIAVVYTCENCGNENRRIIPIREASSGHR
jgi:RNase P subunit RPR2